MGGWLRTAKSSYTGFPKAVNAMASLPETLEKARAALENWRAQNQANKVFKRRGLRLVG